MLSKSKNPKNPYIVKNRKLLKEYSDNRFIMKLEIIKIKIFDITKYLYKNSAETEISEK